MRKNADNINIIKLRSISNEMVLGMIKAILSDNNIPYIVKDYGSGGHMRIITGASPFNTDIMVSEADFEEANNLLESISI